MRNLKRQWTSEDEAMLREWGPKISLMRVAVKLKRTRIGIIERAERLGVTLVRKRRAGKTTARAGGSGVHHALAE